MDADGAGPAGGRNCPLTDGNDRLTAEGRQFVADWVAKHGSGVGLLRRIHGGVWKAALAAGMTPEDVERCCEDATVLAATRFDPAKGAFVTLLTWYIRHGVQKGIDERLGYRNGSKHKPAGMGSLDKDVMGDGGTLYHALPATGDGPEVVAAGRDAADALREALRRAVPAPRDREWLELRFGLGGEPPLTMRAVAERYGVSRARVEQVEKRTLAKLREHLPADFADTILGA